MQKLYSIIWYKLQSVEPVYGYSFNNRHQLSGWGGSCWKWKTKRPWSRRRWGCKDRTWSPHPLLSEPTFGQTSPQGHLQIDSFEHYFRKLQYFWLALNSTSDGGTTTDQYNQKRWCQELQGSQRGIFWSRCSPGSFSPECCLQRPSQCPRPSSSSQQTSLCDIDGINGNTKILCSIMIKSIWYWNTMSHTHWCCGRHIQILVWCFEMLPEDLLTLNEIGRVWEARLDLSGGRTKKIGHQPWNHLSKKIWWKFLYSSCDVLMMMGC